MIKQKVTRRYVLSHTSKQLGSSSSLASPWLSHPGRISLINPNRSISEISMNIIIQQGPKCVGGVYLG